MLAGQGNAIWEDSNSLFNFGNFVKDFRAKHSHIQDYLAENYMTVSKLNGFE